MRETNRVREHPTCHIVMDPFLGIFALAQLEALAAFRADRADHILEFDAGQASGRRDPNHGVPVMPSVRVTPAFAFHAEPLMITHGRVESHREQ